MSRTAAARADDRTARAHAHAPAVPRRTSGPQRPPRAHVDSRALAMSEAVLAPSPMPTRGPRTPSRPPLRIASGGANLVLRVAEATMEVSGSRTMDRLVRSRAWVVIVAFGLIGIVAMQVSMLKLNNGIGRAVETAATLERSNATLRGEVSRLSSGDRIRANAGTRGFVMPEPADVSYLRAGALSSDGLRAARRMQAPNREIAGPAGLMTVQSSVTAITGQADPSAPAGTATTATTATAGTTATAPADAAAPTAPATTAAPPVVAANGAATPAPAAPAATAPAPATTPSGGVTTP